MFKRTFLFFAHSTVFSIGYLYFLLTGKNTERAYQAMVYLFCYTGGRFNASLLKLETLLSSKPLVGLDRQGLLGDAENMQKSAVSQLRAKGYFAKPRALAVDACDRLMDFAMKTPAVVRPMDGEAKGEKRLELVNLDNPAAVRYDYQVGDLLSNPDVQDLLADPSLLALAESYLGKAPKLDVLSMWWHLGYHTQADSEAAQMYHFDLDRPRWLKVFIYLTDVGIDNGPHSFIEGSHRVGAIPDKFLNRGYARLSDEEVLAVYGTKREIVFTAPRGSVIAEDTIGLHKGGVVKGGARLILQFQFSSSLFGAKYPKNSLPVDRTPLLERSIALNPSVYSSYL